MPWDTIEKRVEPETRKPVSVRLTGNNGQPSCIVTVRRFFMDRCSWTAGAAIGAQIGSGEDAGRLRLRRLPAGDKLAIASARGLDKGGLSINLGHLAQLGNEACDTSGADARMVDADTLEIVLPEWNEPADDDDEEEGEKQEESRPAPQPSPAPQRATPPTPAAAPPKPNGRGEPPLSRNGITINFTPDDESIEHKGKVTDLTARQAQVLACLLKASPAPVDFNFIKDRVWGGRTTAADLALAQVAADLEHALPGVGLVLKVAKGVGLALQVKG